MLTRRSIETNPRVARRTSRPTPWTPPVVAALFALTALTVAGCAREAGSSSEAATAVRTEPPRNVRVLTLSPGTIEEYLQLSGPIRPLRGADLATEESGVVARIANDKGSLVEKGEVVVLLERGLLDAERRTAEADRTVAAYNEERTRNLFEANSVSGQEMLLAVSQLEKAKAAEDAARLRFERAAIKAPFAGLVTQRHPDTGELVSPGTVVARIVDPYTLKLLCTASDREVRYVRTGAPVTVELDGTPGTFEGTVAWVGFEANTQNGKFPVEVHVENPDLLLRPGVVGRARVLERTHENVIAIPRDAIVEGGHGPRVFIADGEVARARAVTLGADQGVMVVVEDGLDAGDRLIVRGQRELTDGSRIEVREEATARDGALATDPGEVKQR